MQSAVPEPDFELAARLFDTLAQKTHDTVGITRASYGEGEQLAHDLIAQTGRLAGLATTTDVAGNLYVTLKGDPAKGTFLIASHLDSVPQGGNFDGAAGVIAGIAILTAWKRAGFEDLVEFAAPRFASRPALGGRDFNQARIRREPQQRATVLLL